MLDYGHVFTNVLDYGYVFNSLYLGHSDFKFTSSRVLFGSVSAAVPGDFDHDGVMDVAAITYVTNLPMVGEITSVEVYRGQSRTTNHPPASPSKLRARTISTNEVMLSWDRATDPEQSGGLTYNLRVGTAPGRGDVVSPMSLADGLRLLPRIGNAEWITNRLLTALQPGATYYWSVQAVDNSYAGGPFAPEVFFTVPAASIMINSVAEGQLELELRVAPSTAWRLEASSDLRNWSEYPSTNASTQTWTNGVCWIRFGPSSSNQFFRAKQMR